MKQPSNQSPSQPQKQQLRPQSSQCNSLLIVDDNHGVREALISALRSKGYQARGAANGKEALLTLMTLKAPTLVFMDLMMPVMDGWDSLEHLSLAPEFEDTVVVTISAVNLKSRDDARIPVNAVANLQKPLSFKKVLELVHKYCGESNSARDIQTQSEANA
jgi:CheY-like chemotaxis protein